MKIEKEIGNGTDYIYVYYSENDKKLAILEGKDRWECKIGLSSTDPEKRIISQGVQTAMAKEPVIGLLIRTPNGYDTECKLHRALYQYKLNKTAITGDEWFLTNPSEIEKIFVGENLPSDKNLPQYCEYNSKTILELGECANSHRHKVNLTHKTLSELSGVSRSRIVDFFNGKSNLCLKNLFGVLDALGLEIVLKSKLPSNEIIPHASNRKMRRQKKKNFTLDT